MSKSWNLEDGLKLVRALQPETRRFGYHLALGGGVLNRGESKKDIDLYFLPLENSKLAKADPGALIDWLVKLWGDFTPIGQDYGREDEPPEAREGTLGAVERATNSWWHSSSQQERLIVDNTGFPTFSTETLQDVFNNSTPIQGVQAGVGLTALTELTWQTTAIPLKPRTGAYKYKLQFNRRGVDRIDVFIV